MRKLLLPAAAALAALIFFLSGQADPAHTVSHRVCTEDYPSVYANELKGIFGDFTLGGRAERHIEGEVCSCGYHQDSIDFYEWPVTYTDACGQVHQCILSNAETLPSQLFDWLTDQIAAHFYSQYVERLFEGRLRAGSYCFCFIGRVCTIWTGGTQGEEYAHVETCDQWTENARRSGPLISLASLDYAEIFDRYPILLSIQVMLDDKDLAPVRWASNYEESVRLLNEMASGMADEIGSNLNLHATVYSEASCLSGTEKTEIFTLRGRPAQTDSHSFEHAVFNSYKGKYW